MADLGRERSRTFAVVAVSVLDEASLDAFREAVWELTGLIRVRLHKDGLGRPGARRDGARARPSPTSPTGSTTTWPPTFSGARVWGPSARFDGQRVGRDHEVLDGDVVEILR